MELEDSLEDTMSHQNDKEGGSRSNQGRTLKSRQNRADLDKYEGYLPDLKWSSCEVDQFLI